MAHIEVYTGLKRSQDKKMVVLKVKCGQGHRGTLVTGEIIARKVLVYSFIKMLINMKECGLWIRNMVKEHTGEMMQINSEESTQEIGLKTKNMVEEHFSLKIVIDMMGTG